MGAFIVILLYHMVLGLQVVIDDYVYGEVAGSYSSCCSMRAVRLRRWRRRIFALFRIAGPV